MAGRASIVGAAETSVGKVRDHNEDAHFIDPELGIFIVCDGMGGHAAGEVASNLAVTTIRRQWEGDPTQKVADSWLENGTPEARKQLLTTVQAGVLAAHDAIVAEATADRGKQGMGTTVVAALVVGGDVVFAHCGDSRAYLVRDGITVQLTEDHTLLARLLAAGVDVDTDGDGARFKSMLTNALGIGQECKVSTFVVPVADGDRFLLCSDGITEYLAENEIGEVLTTMPSPARSAQRLVEIALQRGGGDNATALVVRVLEAGETARPAELLRRDEQAIASCGLWAKVNTQQRLRGLRIALPRDHVKGDKVPAQTLGDKVAWILIEGEVEQDGDVRGPGALLYPEALLGDRPVPDKHGLAVAQTDLRALALRADDFKELCDDDPELAEHLLEALAVEITKRRPHRRTGKIAVQPDPAAAADPELGRADTAQFPVLASDDRSRQARASTVPPHMARPRSNTDKGIPVPERPPAGNEGEPPVSSPRMSRGSTPPAEARSSLISTPADTEAAVDIALSELTEESHAEGDGSAQRPLELRPPKRPGPGLKGAPASGKAPVAAEPKGTHLSEPEIHIEQLVEMVADEPDDEERDGSAEASAKASAKASAASEAPGVVEVLKDTSSQRITMTSDDPEVIELVAAEERPRTKRQSDGWD